MARHVRSYNGPQLAKECPPHSALHDDLMSSLIGLKNGTGVDSVAWTNATGDGAI
jgi:hypothetical protein